MKHNIALLLALIGLVIFSSAAPAHSPAPDPDEYLKGLPKPLKGPIGWPNDTKPSVPEKVYNLAEATGSKSNRDHKETQEELEGSKHEAGKTADWWCNGRPFCFLRRRQRIM